MNIISENERELGITGNEDIDNLLLNYIPLKTLVKLFIISKYVKKVIKGNKRIYDLITLLRKNSIYDSKNDIYLFSQEPGYYNPDIENYGLELLVNGDKRKLKRLLDFFDNDDDNELYRKLLSDIIDDDNLKYNENIYKLLFSLRNNKHDEIIQRELDCMQDGSMNYEEFLPIIIVMTKAGISIEDEQLINTIKQKIRYLNDYEIDLTMSDMANEKRNPLPFYNHIQELLDMQMTSVNQYYLDHLYDKYKK